LGLAIDAFSSAIDVDRMLVVMNLYPLRARLPRNLAGVEDRMHELSFGNRMRQDHDTARRINALVETIDVLAAHVAPDDRSDWLNARLDEARRYKIIDSPSISTWGSGGHARSISAVGGRRQGWDADFSPDTVHRRRRDGYKFAQTSATRLREALRTRGSAPRLARRAQRSALENMKLQ
jgi:hypothetical protein